MTTKRCSICKDYKSILEFNKNKRKNDGLQTHCRICSQKRFAKYYSENKEKHIASTSKRKKENIKIVQQYVHDYVKEKGCIDCKENDPCCLDFDHVRGDKRECLSIMIASSCSIETIKKEIAKCEIRCSNCHRKKTAKEQNWYRNINTGSKLNGEQMAFNH